MCDSYILGGKDNYINTMPGTNLEQKISTELSSQLHFTSTDCLPKTSNSNSIHNQKSERYKKGIVYTFQQCRTDSLE